MMGLAVAIAAKAARENAYFMVPKLDVPNERLNEWLKRQLKMEVNSCVERKATGEGVLPGNIITTCMVPKKSRAWFQYSIFPIS